MHVLEFNNRRLTIRLTATLLALATLAITAAVILVDTTYGDGYGRAVPDAPTGTPLWSGIVGLEWNDVPGAESYEVQLFHNGWLDLPASGVNIAFYGPGAVIKDLPTDINYYFRVRAVNAQGASEWSDYLSMSTTHGPLHWTNVPEPTNSAATGAPTISGTPAGTETLLASVSGAAPLPPMSVTVAPSASQELEVSWEAPDGDDALPAAGYKVQWKSGTEDYDGTSQSTRQAVLASSDQLTYTITGMTNGTEYAVRVIAYNGQGEGPASTEATATPEFVAIVDDTGSSATSYTDTSVTG